MKQQPITKWATKQQAPSSSSVKPVTEIQSMYGEHHITVKTKCNNRDIICWFPLCRSEPSNKKSAQGYVVPRKKQDSRGGYFQVGKKRSEGNSLHVYYYKKSKGLTEMPPYNQEYGEYSHHVSHLCHHWWCVNPEHIVHEPGWINQGRKDCAGVDECVCDTFYHCSLANPPKKCLWYNKKANGKETLDEEFIHGMSKEQQARLGTSKEPMHINEVVEIVKSCI